MRYSSHLFFRTDGRLGRYPIIDVDAGGCIRSVIECGETLVEMGSQRFYCGVIVPRFVDEQSGELMSDEACRRAMRFASREEFCRVVAGLTVEAARHCGRFPEIGAIAEGSRPGLLIVDGFDLNSFDGAGARIRGIL